LKTTHVWAITAMLGILPGCVVHDEQDAEDSPVMLTARAGELEVQDEGSVTMGSFRSDGLALTYRSESRGETGYEVTLTLNGASLTAFGDLAKGAHLLDGFAVDNGEDTQLSLQDRELMLSFARAWEQASSGKAMSRAESMLLRATELWVEYPNGLPLQREVISDAARDVTQLCGQYLAWHPVTHDCSHGGDWGAGQWGYASIGERGDAWPDGAYSHHYFHDRPSWGSAQPHKGGSFWAGACLGRCGSGCPAAGGLQQLTQDCANHDICGTGNHNLVFGIWCQDEAASVSDDVLAGPVCEGTGADPQWIRDWEQTGFPAQSP
jgi:hypothetical protein